MVKTEKVKKKETHLEERVGIDIGKLEERLLNEIRSWVSPIMEKYEKSEGEKEKYGKILGSLYEKYVAKEEEEAKKEEVLKNFYNSPAMQHYHKAAEYFKKLKEVKDRAAEKLEKLGEWLGKYEKQRLGAIGRFKAMQEFRRIKYATAIFLVLGVGLLAFSSANITGFVIANKLVSANWTVSFGFIFLVTGLLVSLLARKKVTKVRKRKKRKK